MAELRNIGGTSRHGLVLSRNLVALLGLVSVVVIGSTSSVFVRCFVVTPSTPSLRPHFFLQKAPSSPSLLSSSSWKGPWISRIPRFVANDDSIDNRTSNRSTHGRIVTNKKRNDGDDDYALKNNGSADSIARRQLLFSLLASAASVSSLETSTAAELVRDSPLTSDSTNMIESERILVPPLDTRSYETYTLENGLRVVLCSDPSSNAAAAAMDVHVGAMSDPESVPGLAHFNEHMLFLGTQKYPQEDSFESFLSSNGGSSNAFTDSENTVYYFSMNAQEQNKLGEALDRFGSFFTSPLFTESATGRELNAIESENAKNLQSDIFRLYQIEKSRANIDHPYSKFYTGNKATLLDGTKKQKIDLRTELIKFWSTYYSANQMYFAIVGPQSIPTLKKLVNDAFADIPNNPDRSNTPPEQAWLGKIPPFSNQSNSIIPAQGHVVEIVPVADLRQVTLTWPIIYQSTQDRETQRLLKPAFYVAHLLGHEGPNSLLSYLKKQGWVNGLGASTDTDLSDFYTFEVSVELTNKGLSVIDQIIESVFSYIQMMQRTTIPNYIFSEVLQLSELEWRFLTKGDPGSYAQSLVKSMQEYSPSLYIAGPRRLALKESNTKLIDSSKPRSDFTSNEQRRDTIQATSDLVSQLTVNNALVTVLSKSFDGKTNKIEKWYGTNYNVKPIPPSTLFQWTNCVPTSALGVAYPPPNVFIPTEKGLKVKKPIKTNAQTQSPTFEQLMKPITPPRIIRDDGEEGRWTVYFKEDDRFGQPKAYAIFQLLTKEVYSSAMSASLSQLYEVCARDRLEEYSYDAQLAGLSFNVQVLPRGVRLTFGGYNDKLLDFASYVSEKLAQDVSSVLPESEAEFERYKDQIVRALAAFDVQQPYAHAAYYSSLLFQPKNFLYTNSELREAIEQTSLDDLTTYVTNLWKSGKAESLLQGNLDQKEALKFVSVIDSILAFRTITADQLPSRFEALPLPLVSPQVVPTKIIVSEPNPSNKNSASITSIQSLGKSEKDHVLIEIISAVLAEPFYEDLRTQQQLGYIVSSGVKAVSETRKISFIVQSSVAPADKLSTETLKFLNNVRNKFLIPLTDEDVSMYTKGLILKRTEPDKNLAIEASRNWNEIATGRLQFDRLQREVSTLLDITKDDIIRFWDEIFLGEYGRGRRILISEIVPKSGPASSRAPPRSFATNDQSEGGKVLGNNLILGIDDIDNFRKELEKFV